MPDKKRVSQIDYGLLITILLLVIIGVVLLSSIGVPKSIQLTRPADILFPECGVDGVDCFYLVKRHLIRLGIAMGAFLVTLKIPFTFWRKMAIPIFSISFIFLIAVLIVGQGFETIATSWLVFGNTSLQPTEFAKLGLILYLSLWLSRKGKLVDDFKEGYLSFAALVFMTILPVALQPDLGSTFVFLLIAAGLFYVAGAPRKYLALSLLIGFIGLIIVVPLLTNQKHRITAYINPTPENCQVVVNGKARDFCWQSEQANIAIGNGGFWGRGITKGIQKSYWLPQASDDFIFAASSEELGFLKISLILVLFGVFAYRGLLISRLAPDNFTMLTAAGITIWITGQALVNIGVNVGLLPITGITLPFISYGGSSLIATMAACGILLNISKYAGVKPAKTRANRGRNSRTRHPQFSSYRRG